MIQLHFIQICILQIARIVTLFLFQILYRTEIDGNSDPYYQIEFEERMSDTLAKRKCKHVKAYNGEQNRRTYCLCK